MIVFAHSAAGQQNNQPCPTAGKEGIKIVNKKYFKYFSLLLQDTCSPYNRLNNNPIQLDSMAIIKVEQWCKDSLQLNARQKVKDISDKRAKKRIKNSYRAVNKYKYIRLYMGYKNNEDSLRILVQYVTKKQFNKSSYSDYKEDFDLIGLGRNYRKDPLRFLNLMINKNGEISILSCYNNEPYNVPLYKKVIRKYKRFLYFCKSKK